MKLLYIGRHLRPERAEFWKSVYGDDLEVVSVDVPYGDDPASLVGRLITELGDVVAVAPTAPFPVLMKIVEAFGRTLPILKEEFKRTPQGRIEVVGQDANGRDLFAYDRDVRLTRMVFETEEIGGGER